METFEVHIIDYTGIYKKTLEIYNFSDLEDKINCMVDLLDQNYIKYTSINVYGKNTKLRILEVKYGKFNWHVSEEFLYQYQNLVA